MLIRKYTLFLGLMVAALTTKAQVAEWADSSLIPPSRLAQHNEFVNNQYIFPAKPRSQWEIGIKLGSPSISGDVDALNPNFGVGIHARKSLGYLISVRGEIFTGSAKGLGVKENYNYRNNPAWNNKGYNPAADKVFYNFKTQLTDVSAQLLFNLTNIGFHKAEPKFSLYAIAGVGMTLYDANIDALNASGAKYNFNSISPTLSASETRSALKALLDGTYETPAEKYGSGSSTSVSATFGVGAAFKISKKVNLAIENRFTVVDNDLLDGQKWGPFPAGNPSLSSNNDTYNFLSVGLNINIL